MVIEPASLKPLTAVLERAGYAQFASPGDRHGSWEWPFFRAAKDFTRFVIVAATPVEGLGTLQMELWVGAQAADGRSIRKLVHARRARLEDLAEAVHDLAELAAGAVRQAASLKTVDLVSAPLSPGNGDHLGAGRSPRLARR